MADPILPTEGQEDEQDRRLRHYAEGKAAWATVESLATLDSKVDGVLRLLKGDENDPASTGGLVGAVGKLMGYLEDSYDKAGNPTKGALSRLNTVWGERALAKAAIGVMVMALLGQLALASYNSYTTHTQGQPVRVIATPAPSATP